MAENMYGVIRTDLMAGTTVGSYLASVRYFDEDSNPAQIENGCVLMLDGLLEGEREIFKGVAPDADTPLKNVVIVATPEVFYDERKRNLSDFINPAGANCRGYHIHENDAFGLTAEALNIAEGVTPDVGYTVELMAGIKMNVVATPTSGSTVVGTIKAIEKAGRYTYYVIRVA